MTMRTASTQFEEFHNALYWGGRHGALPAWPTNLDELEAIAAERLPARDFAYLCGGAGRGTTVRANRAAFDDVRFLPRVLRDVGARDHSLTLLGTTMSAPVFVSPMGALCLAHSDADRALARATAARGLPTAISPMADTLIEDITAAAPQGEKWFELLLHSDNAVMESMLARAWAAGCRVLIVGADLPTLGWRPSTLDHGYLPFLQGIGAANIVQDPVFLSTVENPGDPEAIARRWAELSADPSRTWDLLRWARQRWAGPIIIKGVQSTGDARRVVEAGMDGIVVSNHGGRQVDGAMATLDLLPGIVDAVGGRVPVLMDGGVRSGADVVKALALGADAVGLGRVIAWGLAAGGEVGAGHVLDCVLAEMDTTLVNVGVASAKEITRDAVMLLGGV